MFYKLKNNKSVLKGVFFILVSILLLFWGQYLLFYRINLPGGLLFMLPSVVLFVIYDRNHPYREDIKDNILTRIEIPLFFLVFLTGVFFRVYDLKNCPPGFFQDEALASLDALGILRGEKVLFQETSLPVYIKGQVDNPALILYLVVFIFKFFGVGIEQARIAGAVMPGILAIPAFYFLARYLYGIRVALTATFLFSVMGWHVVYSRFFFHASFCVFIVILFLYFFIRSYRERKLVDFILMGVLLGLTQHTYQPVKLIFVWLMVFYLFTYFVEKKFIMQNYKKIIIAMLIAFFIFLPILVHMKNNYKDYFSRIKLLSVFNKENPENFINGRYSLAEVLFNNTVKTLLMFNHVGDENARHNYNRMPMLDFFTGAFAFAGLGCLLTRILQPISFFLVSFFIFAILGSILNVAAPHATRSIMAIPVVIIFASFFLERIFVLAKNSGRVINLVWRVIVFVFFMLILIMNYKYYFNGYCRYINIWDSFAVDQSEAAKYLISLGDNWYGITAHEYGIQYYKSAPFNFVMKSKGKNNFECFNLQKHIPVTGKTDKNIVFLFPAGYQSIVSLLKQIYPNGIYRQFYKKYNEQNLSYFAYEILSDDLKNPQMKDIKSGLTGYYYNGEMWRGKLMDKRNDFFIFIHNDPAVISGIFSVKWEGKIIIDREGIYQFQGESEDDVYWDILINGEIVAESPANKGKIYDRKKVYLKAGIHKIEIRCSSSRDIQKMKMFWLPPGTTEPPVLLPSDILIPETM